MKKICYLFIGLLLLSFKIVKAESFVEGSYISGEYIVKKNNGKTYYMTMQFIKDSNGNIVYCLEPYTKFEEGKSYTTYDGNINGYKDLTDPQKRKIAIISYFGYGYKNRTTNKWYAITQYLIWEVVTNNSGEVYFTDTLNGNKIKKYESEIAELLLDVERFDKKPDFVKSYEVGLGEDLYIEGLSSTYYLILNNVYNRFSTGPNGSTFYNTLEDNTIRIKFKDNYYSNNVMIFDSKDSQDLIKPGKIESTSHYINVYVKKGNIDLIIKDDDSVYTIENDFTNTCYDILKDNEKVDGVCTKNEGLVYKSVDLPYGEYEIKQVSNGIGYKKDINSYKVIISKDNTNPVLTVYNYLIRNDIEIKKYACKNDFCGFEKNAVFEIIDKNNNIVDKLKTDDLGKTLITLGYGSYRVKQISGLDDYSLALEYSEIITDEDTKHFKELFNYYNKMEEKDKKVEVVPTINDKEEKEIEEEPLFKEEIKEEELVIPNTKVDRNFNVFSCIIVIGLLYLIKSIIK